MEIREWQIRKYQTPDGVCPFDEWYSLLAPQTKARVKTRLYRLRIGNFGDYRSVGEGVFELRLHFGPGYRVYYAVADAEIVLLLTGGDKHHQKRDIAAAQLFWQRFKLEKKQDACA